MRHWYMHVIFGLLLMILFVAYFRSESAYNLLVGSIALVLGTMVPDVDHPKSKIRQSFRILMFLTVLFFILFLLNTKGVISFLSSYTNIPVLAAAVVSLFVSVFLVFLFDNIIPPHRGPLHRVSAAAVYAFLCGLIASMVGASISLIAFAGFVGYLSHLVGDLF